MRYVFWRALEKKVVGVVYIKIIQNMYNGVVTKVKTLGGETKDSVYNIY